MKLILIICGPTATGKTALAARLAKKFNGELISADSRQVYRGMDIGTGKDRSQISDVRIWGYDLVKPDEEFSVAQWVEFARGKIRELWGKKKLPIIVGGTGLYLNSLVKPPATLMVKPDWNLRKQLEKLSVKELQERLKQVNPKRWEKMNWSDKHNPRRLIRAIETGNKEYKNIRMYEYTNNVLWIGLKRKDLEKKIDERVRQRVKLGMTGEVKRLMKKYQDWNKPAFSACGYKEWRQYLEGKISRDKAIALWQLHEKQYSRRQLTWLTKNKKIDWIVVP